MQGRVEKNEKKQGTNKNGRQWFLNIVTIDGQKYSTFNAESYIGGIK